MKSVQLKTVRENELKSQHKITTAHTGSGNITSKKPRVEILTKVNFDNNSDVRWDEVEFEMKTW